MADSEAKSEDVFKVDRIRSLLELMREFDLREIDLRQADERIRMCRGTEPALTPVALSANPFSAPAHVVRAASPGVAAPHASGAPPADAEAGNTVYIRSPMVGTFFSRPNPKAERYVSVGDVVSPDTTICIIEAMKVFNEIPAEIRGRIVAILVEDEEPVEYGKPLFKVDTSV
jgi:acetyl-CoA carboxylase biotin carboxyl carrier protein